MKKDSFIPLNGRNNQIGDNQFDRHIAKLVL